MKYEEPIMEVIKMIMHDVITASDELEYDDNYNGEDGFAPRP